MHRKINKLDPMEPIIKCLINSKTNVCESGPRKLEILMLVALRQWMYRFNQRSKES